MNTWLPLCIQYIPQSRRSAKLFSSRRNWVSPNPLPACEWAPPPLVPGGGTHSLAREGVEESHFRRGDIHCGTLNICTVLCGIFLSRLKPYRLVPLHSAFLGAVGSSRTAAALYFPLELRTSRGRGSRPSPTFCSLTVGLQVEQVSVKSVTKCRLLIWSYSWSCLVCESIFRKFSKTSPKRGF